MISSSTTTKLASTTASTSSWVAPPSGTGSSFTSLSSTSPVLDPSAQSSSVSTYSASTSSLTIASPMPTDAVSPGQPAGADRADRLLKIILPSILVPLFILALLVCCCCRPRRARRRAASFNGWGDDAASAFTIEPRFAGLPVLTYLRRASHHSGADSTSRPPSYTYRRASTLVSTRPQQGGNDRPYGTLGRGLATEREDQVRRESHGLLAAQDPCDDDSGESGDDDTTGTMRSRTASKSADRGSSLAYDADLCFVLQDEDDHSSSTAATFSTAATSPDRPVDDGDQNEPTTPAVVRFARISQRGARRLDPRVVRASEFGDFAARVALSHDQGKDAALQPPSKARFDDGRRGSTVTIGSSSHSSTFWSAPSTPLLEPSLPFSPISEQRTSETADPGFVHAKDLIIGPAETIHHVPRKPAPVGSPPPSPRVRLTAAFRPSSDSSSYAPSWRAGRGSLDQSYGQLSTDYAGPGILREATQSVAGLPDGTPAGALQRVRIVEAADIGRRQSSRVSIQHFPRLPLDASPNADVDDYDLTPHNGTPALGEYDLGETGRHSFSRS